MADYALMLKAAGDAVSFSSQVEAARRRRAFKNITDDAIGWERTERLLGGWWDASFAVAGDDGELSEYFAEWLNCIVEEIAGTTTWKGTIWKMALASNGVTREISLDSVYNAVAARYTEHLTNGGFESLGGADTFTGWTDTTSSGGTVAAETTAANVGRGLQSVKLVGSARVSQSVTVTGGRSYRLAASTRGEDFADVENGDFETDGAGDPDDFSGWSEFGTVEVETGANDVNKGLQSAKVSNGGIVYQSVAVKAKHEYKFSVYTRTRDKVAIANGGFEDGSGSTFTGWTNVAGSGAVAEETTLVSRGSRAVKLTAGAYVHQTITVNPKCEYELSFYSRGNGTNDGTYVVRDTTAGADIIAEVGTGSTATSYKNTTVKVLAPPSCTSIQIQFKSRAGLTTAYFDGATFTQKTEDASGNVTLYDATNAIYIIRNHATGIVSDRYSRFEHSFVTPPGCVSLTISLAAPGDGVVWWDQAELEYVAGANGARFTVYDNTNSAFIVRLHKTNHTGAKYQRYEIDFTVPLSCTSVDIRLVGCLDTSIWFDEASLLILEDDKPGEALTAWVTNERSISQYGRKEYLVDATGQPQAKAEYMRDGVLKLSAWPKIKETSYDTGEVKAPLLTVYCLGPLPAANNRRATEVVETDTEAMIRALIAQSDYLTAGAVSVSTSTNRLSTDRRAGVITELARAAFDGNGITSISVDRHNRVTVVTNKGAGLIPTYYLRRGVISENRSGSQAVSTRHIRPGFLIDLDWRGRGGTVQDTGVIDNSRAGVISSITVKEDGTYKIAPATIDDLDSYLSLFDAKTN